MKKILLLALLAISAVGLGYNTLVYQEQGGDKLVVQSGGELQLDSGSTLDLFGADLTVGTADGNSVKKVARATYDVAVDGGGIGAHALGVSLPANAIVTGSLYQVKTQFTDGGSGTVAVSCGSATVLSAGDITGISAETVTEGTIDTLAEAADVGTSACEVTATVASASQTAGKLVYFIEYVESE